MLVGVRKLDKMSLSTQLIDDLADGVAYSFSDWPNSAVPTFGAGVYTVWHKDGRGPGLCALVCTSGMTEVRPQALPTSILPFARPISRQL
jgi:hypothetical protein